MCTLLRKSLILLILYNRQLEEKSVLEVYFDVLFPEISKLDALVVTPLVFCGQSPHAPPFAMKPETMRQRTLRHVQCSSLQPRDINHCRARFARLPQRTMFLRTMILGSDSHCPMSLASHRRHRPVFVLHLCSCTTLRHVPRLGCSCP